MKAFIEWNAITRTYYVRLESRRAEPAKLFNLDGDPATADQTKRGAIDTHTTRKAIAEKAARSAGATEIVHCERDVIRALERMGFTHESALLAKREWFR